MIIMLSSIGLYAQSRISIKTISTKDCNLLSEYDEDKFQKFTPIKKGTNLDIISKWGECIYTVLYKGEEYQIYCGNINTDDWVKFDKMVREYKVKKDKAIKDSINAIKREKFIQDSLLFAYCKESEKNRIARKDSLSKLTSELIEETKKNHPLYIIELKTSYPNTAGGVDLIAEVINTSNKAIKYITFTGYPINSVNDRCYCNIRKYSTVSPKGVGPIPPNDTGAYFFENLWYDGTISEYVPISIHIQYMDGSIKTIMKSEIESLIDISKEVKNMSR